MIEVEQSYCDNAYQMAKSPYILVILFLHLLCSTTSLLLCVFVCIIFLRHQLFELTFKVLIFVMIIYITIFNLSLLSVTIFHLFHIFTHSVPCDIVFYKQDCIGFLYPLFSAFVGLCITQCALGIERLLSSFGISFSLAIKAHRYFYKAFVTLVAVVLLSSGPALYSPFVTQGELQKRLHCTAIILEESGRPSSFLYQILLGIEFFAAVLFVVSWRISKATQANGDYSVSKRLKARTNFMTIRLFGPQVISHVLFICFFILSSYGLSYARPYLTPDGSVKLTFSLYALPYFTLVQLSLLIWILRREERMKRMKLVQSVMNTKNQTRHMDLYRSNLENAWKFQG